MNFFDFKKFQRDVCAKMFEDPSEKMPEWRKVQEVVNYKPEPSKRKNHLRSSEPGPSREMNNSANTSTNKKRGRPPGSKNSNNIATPSASTLNSSLIASPDHSFFLSQMAKFNPAEIASLLQQAKNAAAAVSASKIEPSASAPVPIVEEKQVAPGVSSPDDDDESPPKKRKISVPRKKTVNKQEIESRTSAPKPKKKLTTPRRYRNSLSTSKQDSDDDSLNGPTVGTPKTEFELFKENQALKNKEQGVRRSRRGKWRKVECKVEIIQKTFEEIHCQEEFLHLFGLQKKVREVEDVTL